MIDIKTVLYIAGFLFTVAGMIGAFFTMQTKQNMKIEQLEVGQKELKRKQSDSTHYQIDTEKALVKIGEQLDRLIKDMDELKAKGCGRCHDKG